MKTTQLNRIEDRLKERVKEITGCDDQRKFQADEEFNSSRVIRLERPFVAMDGVTDDTAAVQSTVDKLLYSGGGIIIFPPGNYLLDKVHVGPTITLWGYGARLHKPSLEFYAAREMSARYSDSSKQADHHAAMVVRLAQVIPKNPVHKLVYSINYDAAPDRVTFFVTKYIPPEERPPLMEELRESFRVALGFTQRLGDRVLFEYMSNLDHVRYVISHARTFTTQSNTDGSTATLPSSSYFHRGDSDSDPLVIKGFYFDGHRHEMGLYANYELEQQAMIFLSAGNTSTGKLRFYGRDLCFKDGVADGITIKTSVDATIRNVAARDVFRGALTAVGGNCRIDLADLDASGVDHPTGIDWEPEPNFLVVDGQVVSANGGEGVGTVHSVLDNIYLQGDFDVSVPDGGSFEASRITSKAPHFSIGCPGTASRVRIRDSTFHVGHFQRSTQATPYLPGRFISRIAYPYDVCFENVEFHAFAPEPGEFDVEFDTYACLAIIPRGNNNRESNKRLCFKRCRFTYNQNLQAIPATRALATGNELLDTNSYLTMEDCVVGQGFTHGLFIGGSHGGFGVSEQWGGGRFQISNTQMHCETAVFVGSAARFQVHVDLRGLSVGLGTALYELPDTGLHGEVITEGEAEPVVDCCRSSSSLLRNERGRMWTKEDGRED